MVFPSLLGSTLLRTQRVHLPQIFRRYKSLTQSIEQGKYSGPDRPSRPRARSSPDDAGDASERTRRELRFERFGPARDGGDAPRRPREDRPSKDHNERTTAPRSSRFGRVGPPRPRGDAPSRFSEERPPRDGGERPQRRDDNFGRSSGGMASGGSRFSNDWNDKPPFRERFGQRDEQPRRERSFEPREGKPFEPRERKSFGSRDRKPFQSQERRPWENRDRKPFESREKRPWEDRGRRPFERDVKVTGYQDRSAGSAYRGKEARYDAQEGNPEGPERSFKRHDTTPYQRERPAGERSEPMPPRETSTKQSDTPPRVAAKPDFLQTLFRGPETLPYTTAASEFIYGYSSVLAAMKANRRKLYKLYVHSRGASRDGLLTRIRALKLFPILEEVGDDHLRAMDRASSGRPHNGVVLESSPLPVSPITELKTPSMEDESFSVTLDSQSTEDALVNGKQELYSYRSAGWRHPLILFVDGVLDEGNLGAIARSVYFLGVDAIVTPTRRVAPWSHIALKASAGAAEAIPIFKVGEATDFLGKSSRAGWRIYASDAVPTPSSVTPEVQADTHSNVVYSFARSTKRLPADHCPVADHPTILMMGAEGTGLRGSLLNLAHYNVGITHGREADEVGVDSLNVSVAASLLCYGMLQKPKQTSQPKAEDALF